MSTIRVKGLGGVNLMARTFVAASHQRRLVKHWSKGLSIYAIVLSGLAAMLWGSGGKREELKDASKILDSKIESRKRELADASGRASALRKQLRAAEAVGQHPDWGHVLALVATKANGGVVLSGTTLTVSEPQKAADAAASKAKAKTDKGKEASPRTATIVLTGQAQGLSDVQDYVLILEDLNMFDAVRLKDATNSESSGSVRTTRFEIICKIEERRIGGKP